MIRPGARWSFPPSCAWEAGSAATATATPSSRRMRCVRRCAAEQARARLLPRRAASAWAPSCRSTGASRTSPTRCRSWPNARPISRPIARTSPTAAPSPASTPGSPRPPRGCGMPTCARQRWARRRPTTVRRVRAISRSCIAPCARTDRRSWRAAGCASCAARSMCSASIWPGSTCARTPTSMSAWSPSFSRRPAPARTTTGCRRTSASPCCWRSSRTPRPLISPFVDYSEETASRARHRARGGGGAPPLRPRRRAELRHLQGERSVRRAGGGPAAQGSRPAASARRRLDLNIVPLFETIADLRSCGGVMDALLRPARLHAPAGEPRRACRR